MLKSYIVDSTCNNMRVDRWIRNIIGRIPQGLIEKSLRSGKIKVNKKKIKSSHKIKSNDKIDFYDFKFEERIPQKKISFNPSNQIIKANENLIIDNNSGGTVNIRPKIGEEGVVCTTDGSTALYHDGTKKFETTTNGAEITGRLDLTGGYLSIDDNYAVLMGTGGDAQLYHSGSHQYLLNTTGNTYLMPKAGETGIAIIPDGAVAVSYTHLTLPTNREV